MIRVLVVEDSAVARDYILYILSKDPEILIAGTARNGKEALDCLEQIKPDVITMDINMPVMDGLEATRRIMETTPVPIVIVSGVWDPREVQTTFKAMEAGALAIVQRPAGIGHPDAATAARELTLKVKLMSEVKVVRRWPRQKQEPAIAQQQPQQPVAPAAAAASVPLPEVRLPADVKVVAIGASTGGPMVLRKILNGLPGTYPASILIVQHMASGFLKGMIDWLSQTSGVPLCLGAQGTRVLPGHAYFAPEGADLGVNSSGVLHINPRHEQGQIVQSVSYLFRSVADAFGRRAVGILLTGMGSDGSRELKLMKERGAVTIAQDKESCVIFGMPGVAVELNAATHVLPPDRIIEVLNTLNGCSQAVES